MKIGLSKPFSVIPKVEIEVVVAPVVMVYLFPAIEEIVGVTVKTAYSS